MKIAVNESIALTEFLPEDKAALVLWLNDRTIYEQTLHLPYPYGEVQADDWLNTVARMTEQRGEPINFAIRHAQDGLIGSLGFSALAVGHSAELGYWLARPYWGQGIMTRVVRAASDWARARWGLVRVTAHVFSFNKASARVLEKCGYTHEGTLRKARVKDGKFIDAKVYALVDERVPNSGEFTRGT